MQSIEVLYEDEDIIAVNKPAGMLSQSTPDPKRPHLISVLSEQRGGSPTFFLHHRLDKDTSGVVILGKSARANSPLTEIFREHKIEKTYLALSLRKENSLDVISNPSFKVENHIAPVRGNNKQLMRMVKVNKGGWRAETHFQLLESFEHLYLIQAKPITGRTHQIRVHLAGEKLPIAGDNLYGGKSNLVPRLMLHAQSLILPHPISGTSIKIEAPLAKDFSTVLEKLRAKKS